MKTKKVYNIHDAKTHFSKIVKAVTQGQNIVIAMAGKPVAEISAYTPAGSIRQPGSAAGEITIKDSFFDDLPVAMVDAFEG